MTFAVLRKGEKMTKPKAYVITDRDRWENSAIVVFAETAGKAKAYGMYTDEFGDFEFTELRAHRAPALDDFYKGRDRMDWFIGEDRIAMVRFADFRCSDDMDMDKEECRACVAFEWCGAVEEWRDEA